MNERTKKRGEKVNSFYHASQRSARQATGTRGDHGRLPLVGVSLLDDTPKSYLGQLIIQKDDGYFAAIGQKKIVGICTQNRMIGRQILPHCI